MVDDEMLRLVVGTIIVTELDESSMYVHMIGMGRKGAGQLSTSKFFLPHLE